MGLSGPQKHKWRAPCSGYSLLFLPLLFVTSPFPSLIPLFLLLFFLCDTSLSLSLSLPLTLTPIESHLLQDAESRPVWGLSYCSNRLAPLDGISKPQEAPHISASISLTPCYHKLSVAALEPWNARTERELRAGPPLLLFTPESRKPKTIPENSRYSLQIC